MIYINNIDWWFLMDGNKEKQDEKNITHEPQHSGDNSNSSEIEPAKHYRDISDKALQDDNEVKIIKDETSKSTKKIEITEKRVTEQSKEKVSKNDDSILKNSESGSEESFKKVKDNEELIKSIKETKTTIITEPLKTKETKEEKETIETNEKIKTKEVKQTIEISEESKKDNSKEEPKEESKSTENVKDKITEPEDSKNEESKKEEPKEESENREKKESIDKKEDKKTQVWFKKYCKSNIAVCIILLILSVWIVSILFNNNTPTIKNIDMAISNYKTALAKDPHNTYLHYKLSEVYIDQKRYNDAIKELQKVVDAGVKSSELYFLKGKASYYQGRFDEAKSYFSQSADIDSKNYETYLYLGKINYINSNYRAAEKSYLTANKIYYSLTRSEYIRGHHDLALLYKYLGKYKKAIEKINELPNMCKNHIILASIYTEQYILHHNDEMMNKAKVELSKIDLNQESSACYAMYHKELGKIYYYQKRYDSAIKEFREAIKSYPNYSSAYYYLGKVYESKPEMKSVADIGYTGK